MKDILWVTFCITLRLLPCSVRWSSIVGSQSEKMCRKSSIGRPWLLLAFCSCRCYEFNGKKGQRFTASPFSILISNFYSCSPLFALPSPPKWTGCRFAVSNTPTVTKTPARRIAWTIALTPKTTIDPIHIEKTMHHIQASICMTRWRVEVSGMWASGLWRLSMTKL